MGRAARMAASVNIPVAYRQASGVRQETRKRLDRFTLCSEAALYNGREGFQGGSETKIFTGGINGC
jgi:hypothetical protein